MIDTLLFLLKLTQDYEAITLLAVGGIGYFIKQRIENKNKRRILASAIIAEIESIESRYNFATMGGLKAEGVRQFTPGSIEVFSLEITQDYFTVYHNNTEKIGLFTLGDVASVIGFYVAAKGLVDSFLAWNDYLEDYNKFFFESIRDETSENPTFRAKIDEMFGFIPVYYASLLEQQSITFNKAQAVKQALKKYC